jgi:hypothetical protein
MGSSVASAIGSSVAGSAALVQPTTTRAATIRIRGNKIFRRFIFSLLYFYLTIALARINQTDFN